MDDEEANRLLSSAAAFACEKSSELRSEFLPPPACNRLPNMSTEADNAEASADFPPAKADENSADRSAEDGVPW